MSKTVLERAKKKYIKSDYVHRFGWLDINDVMIPQIFIEAGTNEYKIQKCIDYYNKHGHMDKPVQVTGFNNYCKDGVSRWIASVWLGLDKVWVEYI